MFASALYPAAALCGGGVSAWLALTAWQRRDRPGAGAFAVMTAGAAWWALAYALALWTFDPAVRRTMEAVMYAGKGAVPVGWFAFALAYTGHGHVVSRRRLAALAAVPAVTLALMLTNPAHGLVWREFTVVGETVAGVAVVPGPVFYLHVGYSYALIGLGTLVLLGVVLSEGWLFSLQGLVLTGGTGAAVAANLAWLFDLGPVPGVDPTPVVLPVTWLAFAFALLRLDLLGLSPAPRVLGRRVALDGFRDAVLTAGAEGTVVDANAAAEALFETRPLGERVDALLGLEELPAEGRVETELLTAAGRRRFAVSVSPVEDRAGRTLGRTYVLHDVTDRQRREQRLAVLSRVLRHNLRNDVNVIRGNAETVEGATPDDERAIDAVERAADRLAGLSRKASTVELVAEATATDGGGGVTVADVLERAIDRVRAEHEDAHVEARVDPALADASGCDVLEAVATNLLENAAKHGAGTVRLQATVEDARAEEPVGRYARLVVADDGPGLPEQERATLTADTERPLCHSSGLGLWLVRWGVGALGGELAVDAEASEGTRITVRYPLDPEEAGTEETTFAASSREGEGTPRAQPRTL